MRNIYNKIKNKKAISFDIFDTLIKRNCQKPRDIFAIVEKVFNETSDEKIEDFVVQRRNAHYLALEKSEKDEVTLNEIYNNLPYSKKIKEDLQKIEIDTEIKFCQKNEKIYDIYQFALDKNKEIFCISDMYLPKEVIKNILDKNGYSFDLKHIFVSCDYKVSKKTGKLYAAFLKNIDYKANEILHIGDSWKYDYLMAKKYKLKSIHIKRNINNMHHLKYKESNNLADNIIQNIINNNSLKIKNSYQKLGYELLGPFCLTFCLWLNKLCIDEKINNILFCSRDMKLMMEIYNELFQSHAIKNHYFYVSRKSLVLPHLFENNDYDEVIKVLLPRFEGSRKVTLEEVLKRLNINVSKIPSNIFEKYHLSLNRKVNGKDLIKNPNFIDFYNSYLTSYIYEETKKQNSYFKKYLRELSIDKNTLVVDCGWRCTMQKMMAKYWAPNIKGAYIGVKTNFEEITSKNTFAFLFFNENNDYYNKLINGFHLLVENMIEALHGSVLKYQNENPIYVLSEPHLENQEKIKNIHQGIKEFINDIKDYYEYIDNLDEDIYINNFLRIGTNPTINEAKLLGEFINEDNTLTVRKYASPNKLLYYMFHPKKFKEDFTNSEWKIGFMKRMLKINIDYYKLFNLLKQWKGRK